MEKVLKIKAAVFSPQPFTISNKMKNLQDSLPLLVADQQLLSTGCPLLPHKPAP